MNIKDTEGWLSVDNRASGGKHVEMATYTCKHCQRVVIMNPERVRERAYCRGCSHVICDGCAAIKAVTLRCVTFEQVIDEMLTAAESGQKEF